MYFKKGIKSNFCEAVGCSSIWGLHHTNKQMLCLPQTNMWTAKVADAACPCDKWKSDKIHELCLLSKQDTSCLLLSTTENQAKVVILKSIFFLCSKWLGITKATMQTSALGLLCGSRECISIQPSDKASVWHLELQRTNILTVWSPVWLSCV